MIAFKLKNLQYSPLARLAAFRWLRITWSENGPKTSGKSLCSSFGVVCLFTLPFIIRVWSFLSSSPSDFHCFATLPIFIKWKFTEFIEWKLIEFFARVTHSIAQSQMMAARWINLFELLDCYFVFMLLYACCDLTGGNEMNSYILHRPLSVYKEIIFHTNKMHKTK